MKWEKALLKSHPIKGNKDIKERERDGKKLFVHFNRFL
jgi:hypothetical protein